MTTVLHKSDALHFTSSFARMSMRLTFLRESCGATEEELAEVTSVNLLKRSIGQRERTSVGSLSEILDSWLFQGNWKEANDQELLDAHSITHLINVTDQTLINRSRKVLHLASPNGRLADLSSSFGQSNAFLDACRAENGRALVHCERGVSRSSTILIAYLMHHRRCSLKEAFVYLLERRPQASPNHVLLLQLVRYEKNPQSNE